MIDKVIVLGGGSAGLMAAIALKGKMPALRVLVIRSRDIGIIGVGEGSTIALTLFLHEYMNVGRKKFFEVAQPTWKLGLKYLWGPRPFFHYAFGKQQLDGKLPGLPKAAGFYADGDRDLEFWDPHSALMTLDRAFPRDANGWPVLHPDQNYAYHVENEKFVAYLEQFAAARGVEFHDDTVTGVRQDQNGVSALALASGRVESAGLYVDCSGFASLLLGKALKEPFVSYRNSLFCERAVVGGWDRADEVIKPYTTCETMDSGWCWQIEHENRINRGYVYCPAFIGDAEAEAEFRAKNPKVGPTRVVRFVSGRYQRAWVKNVVAIGNAGGFVEPLEATALGVIAIQSRLLASALEDADRTVRPTHAAQYNNHHGRYWDAIRNFLSVHYKFNTRLDTPFWRACWNETDLVGAAPIVEYYGENGPSGFWAPSLTDPFDQFGIGGYVTLLAGQRVPHRSPHTPSDRELKVWNEMRWKNQLAAARGLTVKEALAAVRSPRWVWPERPAAKGG